MPNVRVLVWNIKWFSRATIADAVRASKIVGLVQPAAVLGAAQPPNYDIFIVLEPKDFPANTALAASPATGAGIQALQILYYCLHHRNPAWAAVPPRALTAGTKREVLGVFYFTTNVNFLGPEQIAVAAPAAVAALPNGFGAVPVGPPWGAAIGNVNVGRVLHPKSVPPPLDQEFPAAANRRPYLLRFSTPGGPPLQFNLYAFHAAPDGDYPDNAEGVENLAEVADIGQNRALPTLIAGDFNCCTLPCGTHQPDETNAQSRIAGEDANAYSYWDDAMLVMRLSCALTTAAQNTVTSGPLGKAALAQAMQPDLVNLNAAANRIDAVVADPPLTALIVTATGAAVLPGATALTADALAIAARDAAIGIADRLGANYNAPPLLQNIALAVHHTAIAIDQVNAASAAGAVIGANAAGAAVTAGTNTAHAAFRPVEFAAAANAGGAATAATAITPNLAALAATARDALIALTVLHYKTHIVQRRSSLQTPANAQPGNYTLHAFDHMLTHGFAAESNAQINDVIFNDPGYAAASVAAQRTWWAFFRRLYKGPGSGQHGISDHLPASMTVTT